MEKNWYCTSELLKTNPLHTHYHDTEYGFPLKTDDDLFERLCLEINQAGLSWTTILKKRSAFKEAFHHFHIPTIAAYTLADQDRLMADAGIIRNRKKIEAVIENARRILAFPTGFKGWLDANHPLDLKDWVKLFKKTFVFTGPEIVNEFLLSTGYLPGAHSPTCPIAQILKS